MTERNWLDVYPYTSWGGNANLPVFNTGQTFVPTVLDLREVRAATLGLSTGVLCTITWPAGHACEQSKPYCMHSCAARLMVSKLNG